MENKLMNIELDNEGRITSVDLVEIINYFREVEDENKSTLRHDSLMSKIKKEVEVMRKMKAKSLQNFLESKYTNTRGKSYPCYSLNKNGMLQILNSESIAVRCRTMEYVEELENKVKELMSRQSPSYLIQDSIERAKAWIKEEEQRRALELETKQQKQIIGELKPKADYTDIILKSTDTITVTQIAKDYGMSAKALNSKLHELKVQFKQSGQWFLYSIYHDKGYTKSETTYFQKKDGTQGSSMNTKWTQKGRLFLYDLLKQNDILPLIEQ